MPGEPDPASSTQVWQVEWGLSTVQIELNWSYRPHGHVDVKASEECPGSPHLSYHYMLHKSKKLLLHEDLLLMHGLLLRL